MPLPFRLAAVDLDDTLLGPDKEISRANVDAMQRLVDAGVTVVLASGRRHENMRRFYHELGLRTGWIVSCNGAMARDENTGETIHEKLMPQGLVAEILAEGDRLGVTQNFYHLDGELYASNMDEWIDIYMARTKATVAAVSDIVALKDDPALKIIWIVAPEDAIALGEKMRAQYSPDVLHIVITDPEYLEFMASGVNKEVGLEAVAARLGIPASECVAFGDGNNDVEMLKWAGRGIAMPHARPSAQAAADYIAPDGNPETAFARAVATLFERES